MTERDYAAPLDENKRASIWGRLFAGRPSSIWDSVPPLTADLRKGFSDLLRGETTTRDDSQVPISPRDKQPVHQKLKEPGRQPTRNDSVQDTESTAQNNELRQPPRRSCTAPSNQAPLNQGLDQGDTEYQRDAQGHLFQIPTSQRPAREQTIRRRPVHSSLRSQVPQNEQFRTRKEPTSQHTSTYTATRILYSHGSKTPVPCVLSGPTQPHTHQPTLAELQRDILTSHPQGLEQSFKHSPPLPPNPGSQSNPPLNPSECSLGTFSNPNTTRPPLTWLESQIISIKNHVVWKTCSWTRQAVELPRKIRDSVADARENEGPGLMFVVGGAVEGVAEFGGRVKGVLRRCEVLGSVLVFHGEEEQNGGRCQSREESN